jgi:colanic acid/amylovoran biosynthesis glycosyltransferase
MKKVAYVLARFPVEIETFIVNELRHFKRVDDIVSCVCCLKSEPSDLQAELQPAVFTKLDFRQIPALLLGCLLHPLQVLTLLYTAIRLDWQRMFCLQPGYSSLLKSVLLIPALIDLHSRVPKEVTHFHAHFAAIPTTVACLLARLRGGTFSFTAHGSDLFVYAPKDFTYRLQGATFCVTVSQFNKKHFRDKWGEVLAKKVHVIRCGISVASYQGLRTTALQCPPRFVTVARLHPVKGLDSFLGAMGKHLREGGPRFVYTIIGDGSEMDALQRLVRQEGLENHVEFLGYGDPTLVRKGLGMADLFVLPSYSEGFPVVLMEAAAAGLPLLASRITGIPEILQEGVNGHFLLPGDPGQQARALKKLSGNDWQELRTLSLQATSINLDEYDLALSMRKLEDLFKRLDQ